MFYGFKRVSVLPNSESHLGNVGSNLLGWEMGPAAEVRLISDAKRPGLVGLHAVHAADRWRSQNYAENEYWLNPAKDDMPVETTWRDYATDPKTVTMELHTQYLEYAQLPSGQWYPTHWRVNGTVVRPGQAVTQPSKWVEEVNLIVAPGMELGKEWFINPAEKFGEKKPGSNTKE